MRRELLSTGGARTSASLLVCGLSGGLAGYYYEIHRIFLDATSKDIPARSARAFVVTAVLSVLIWFLVKAFAGTTANRVLKKSLVVLAHTIVWLAIVHVSYILVKNTEFIFRYDGVLSDILRVYPVFVALSLLVALVLRFTCRASFAMASILTFLLSTTYVLIRTGTLVGVGLSLFYFVYLVLLGRFVAAGIARLSRLRFESALDTLLVSFVCGILGNYLLWYTLGQLSLLYTSVVYGVILPVTIAGLMRYGRRIVLEASGTITVANTLLNRETSRTTAVLLNVTLFCLLLLTALLTIKFPGNSDSSARMYCATVYKFTELHRIAFLPFYQHWPLIFQPLLAEISGLPLYLTGGITALRFFHGTVYFSFIPFVVLFCRKYNLSYRTVVVLVLTIVSSSFSFNMAYFDKPGVIAFPAFFSFLAISLVMLKDLKPWYIILAGGLAAIIYNSKLVLMHGVVAGVVMLCVYFVFNRPQEPARNFRRAILVSVGIFVAVCAVHAGQNIYLRGNPVHPFAAAVFSTSRDYPEELHFADMPAIFYGRTMPIARPSQISTINVDSAKGMYRPYISISPDRGGRGYGIAKHSVSIALILVAILLPVIPLVRSDRVILFCLILAAFSYFVWFGWIGDSWRYSTFFPCISLLGAVLTSRRFLANRYLDIAWRYFFYSLLVLSIPIGLYFMAGTPTTGHLFNFLSSGAEKHRTLAPKDHVITDYLNEQRDTKPVLLVADMEVSQYGFFQPNFLYQPIHTHKDLFTNMVYLSVIKPTHLLTRQDVDRSVLIEHYPFLKNHLVREFETRRARKRYVLYKFDEDTPWDQYHAEYRDREPFVPGHIRDIERVLKGYR